MARLKKHEEGLIVETFYGINKRTFAVESVSLTEGGVLRKYNQDMQVSEHPVLHGKSPQTEIVIVWHLTDLISFRQGFSNEKKVKEAIEGLKAKAARMKEDQENTLGG